MTSPPPADALARTGVRIRGPTSVFLGEHVVPLGRISVLLLQSLERTSIITPAAKARLWGDPDVPDSRLRQVVYRVNATLAAAGWRWRVRFDAGIVLLMEEPGAANAPSPASD